MTASDLAKVSMGKGGAGGFLSKQRERNPRGPEISKPGVVENGEGAGRTLSRSRGQKAYRARRSDPSRGLASVIQHVLWCLLLFFLGLRKAV